ncbi:Uncharacterised protein [Mycobacteroides abscessus subsp. abscessus]|nr:Uncharacterised protein [Mycobacteroides abscessus subsp. abscessus]
MAAHSVEVDTGRDRYPRARQQVRTPLFGIIGQMLDIGVRIERTVGWRDLGNSHGGKAVDEQCPVGRVTAYVPVELVTSLGTEGRERSILGDGRRADREVGGQPVHGTQKPARHQHPAQPPARHREVLGHRAHHDRFTAEFPCTGSLLVAIGKPVINLVGDQQSAVGLTPQRDRLQLARIDDSAGRVGRAGDDEARGYAAVGLRESLQHGHCRLISRLGAAIQFHNSTAQRGKAIAICRVPWPSHHDGVPHVEGGEK